MECTTKFSDFISNIRLTDSMNQELSKAYKQLKANLNSNEISKQIIAMFLQGSYARHTGVKPINIKDSLDVDLVVVTRFNEKEMTPQQALDAFKPFLHTYYEGKFRMQGRSIGINLDKCDIDLVPTALPSASVQRFLIESFENNREFVDAFYKSDKVINDLKSFAKTTDEWKNEPLRIPNREAKQWDSTHPIAQINWTIKKNELTSGEYINVVKALKWWKKNYCKNADTIKSYPLEHFIGECCPSGNIKIAELITLTLERMSRQNTKPYLADRGVPEHDVFGRVDEEDYKSFISQIKTIAKMAREAYETESNYDSSVIWRNIFGNQFPLYEKDGPSFTKREEPSTPDKPTRYAK